MTKGLTGVLLHPFRTGFVMYARAVAHAARFSKPPGPSELLRRGWDVHARLAGVFEHPELPAGFGWYDQVGSFWLASRVRRNADYRAVAEVGVATFRRHPDQLVTSPTSIDMPVHGPDLPRVEPPVSRMRVFPNEADRPWLENILGVPSEFAVTCTFQSNSDRPSFFASLNLGGSLMVKDEDGRVRARREVLSGDMRHVASFPPDIPHFIGYAACRLYCRVLELGAAMQMGASKSRTGNFKQLATVVTRPRTGHAALLMQLPTEHRDELYVASPAGVVPCTRQTIAKVVADLDAA